MSFVISFTPEVAVVILKLVLTQKAHNHQAVELAIKLMLWLSCTVPFPAPLFMIYLKVDPLYAVFDDDHNWVFFILHILVRSVILFIVIIDVTKATNSCFIVVLMVNCSTNNILQDLAETSVQPNLAMRLQEINLYKKMFLWNKYTNQNFCSFSVPPLICFGFYIVTLTYYGTIRMAGKLGFLLYLCLPTVALLSSMFIIVSIPHAASVVENSENFISSRANGKISKFERKTLKSVRCMGVQVGPYGYIIKDLKMIAFKYISENTINLLLTF
ncbi:hypothetical protein Fcan01_25913 [Folsomia candida]|uniref:Uncharacterized protein n=1 Tax=Folsomia candida TaxID=158441 RepID=A0A226D147_FOLCA|nr:hypothetical protein Fcan01_25913 [Folsomia candida]